MSARTTCLVLGAICCLAFPWSQAPGQVATDGTVGPRLELAGPNYGIGAELGSRAGSNLFHSFERFSLGTGESAAFSGPDDVRNVISRVTGGTRSDIDGALRSTIPGADFFFVNPAGVVFGPNASLDVQGSFHVSTADELRFSDGAVFSATNPSASSLTVAAPEAFGFLGADHAAITVDRSTLEVPAGGETLSIVGGSLSLSDGAIAAPGGAVNLVSAASSPEVRVSDGEPASLDGGEIEIGRSTVFTGGDGGGTVRVRGGNFVVEDRSLIDASNFGDRPGHGSIDVRLVGDLTLRQSLIRAGSFGSGSGGTVDIAAANITLDGGQIDVSAFFGAAGNATLDATGGLLIEGTPLNDHPGAVLVGVRSGIFANTRSPGPAGTISIDAGRLSLADQGNITASTFGEGPGGSIAVSAGDVQLSEGAEISSSTSAGGDAGSVTVTVTAGDLEIRDGGQISSSTFAGGAAGSVTINATGPVEVRNGGLIVSGTRARGSGGMVTVEAERLVVSGDGAQDLTGITSQAAPGSTGNAGAVKVRAGELEIRDGGEISSGTFGSGNAGTVTVQADRRLHIDGEGDSEFSTGISTSADFFRTPNGEVRRSTGNAGAVRVRAGELEIRDGGEISSNTLGSGNAGTVTVQAERLLHIDGAGGKLLTGISSSAAFVVTRDGILVAGQGNAGAVNVIVTAGDLEIRDDGEISSAAFGGGDAGKVTVEADRLVLDRAAIITTSASAGGGEIQLLVGDVIDLHDSAIITSVAGGNDPTAGNIRIDPTFLIIDGSTIEADASSGSGGNVRINADNILVPEGDLEGLLARGDISASGATEEVDGTVAISAPEVDMTGGLIVLEVPLLDAASLLRERCAARRDIGASSFTGMGRGGLPPGPDQPLMSDYTTGAAGGGEGARSGSVGADVALLDAPTGQDGVLLLQPCAGAL